MFIDTHNHLYFDCFSPVQETIQQLLQAGFAGLILIGIDLKSTYQAAKLAASFPGRVHYSAGLHPTYQHPPEALDELARILDQTPAPVAIGECGIDLHHQTTPLDYQLELFGQQIELAKQRGLPVVVHQRKAAAQVLDLVSSHPDACFIFHCFDGSPELLGWGLKQRAYFGFAGNSTYGDQLIEQAIKILPLSKLLLETDAPFLAPHPWRGRPSHPAMLVSTCEHLAQLRGLSLVEFAAQTTTNAKEAFSL